MGSAPIHPDPPICMESDLPGGRTSPWAKTSVAGSPLSTGVRQDRLPAQSLSTTACRHFPAGRPEEDLLPIRRPDRPPVISGVRREPCGCSGYVRQSSKCRDFRCECPAAKRVTIPTATSPLAATRATSKRTTGVSAPAKARGATHALTVRFVCSPAFCRMTGVPNADSSLLLAHIEYATWALGRAFALIDTLPPEGITQRPAMLAGQSPRCVICTRQTGITLSTSRAVRPARRCARARSTFPSAKLRKSMQHSVGILDFTALHP